MTEVTDSSLSYVLVNKRLHLKCYDNFPYHNRGEQCSLF